MELNHEFYVEADWVYAQMKNPNLVILDIPYGKNEYVKEFDNEKRKYKAKHIPGAIEIDKNEIQGKDTDLNLYDAKYLETVFLSKGVDKDTLLVVYSDGVIAAARVAFAAYWLGVKQVKILNGGLYAWAKFGYPFSDKIEKPVTKLQFGISVPARPEILISTPEDVIKKQKESQNFVLANVRSWKEFLGSESGYPYVEGAGSPYNSTFALASQSRVDIDLILDDRGHFGDLNMILMNWAEWGITPDKEVSFLCGAGWRAAAVFFISKELGWNKTSIYDGGWYQWLKYHQKDPEKYKIQNGNPKVPNDMRFY